MRRRGIRREMAQLKEAVYRMWIEGERGNAETPDLRAERHRLTRRWYELRRELRAS